MFCERRAMKKKTKKRPDIKFKSIFLFLLVFTALVFLGARILGIGMDSINGAMYPRKYERYVEYYAGKYQVDPLLLYAFIRTESSFDPNANAESTDARGLMQITEICYDWVKGNIAPTEDLTFDDMYDPETNIRFGSYYLSYCLLRYDEDISTAAAAYHSGWGTVDALLEDEGYSQNGTTLDVFPFEQMGLYVRKINNAYEQYKRLYS